MTELRPCSFQDRAGKTLKGWFHRWADSTAFDESDHPLGLTVALIEDETGQIHDVEPQRVKFVKMNRPELKGFVDLS